MKRNRGSDDTIGIFAGGESARRLSRYRWSIDFGDGVSQDAGTTWEDCLDAAQDAFRDQVQDLDWRRPSSPSLAEWEFFLRPTGKVVAKAYRQRT